MRIRSFIRPAALLAFWLASPIAYGAPYAGARMKKIYDPKATPIAAGALLTGGGQGHLSDAQYQQLKYVAKEVLTRFPPSTHYYIGLGRSPSAIISMFQNLTADGAPAEEVAMNFPASGMHDGGVHDDASYFRHFDAMLPKEIVSGNRTIVLLDRSRPFNGQAASGGASLHMFKQILERYLAHKGSSAKVEAVGFSYGNLNPSFGLKHIAFDMNTRPELERISMPYYEAIAEYPEHRIGPQATVPGRRAEYKQYAKFMRERMERDAELDTFLDKTIASELKQPTAEELAAQKVAEKRTAAERAAHAEEEAKAFGAAMTKTLRTLVKELPPREDGHDKGPYLSESAEKLNDWLAETLHVQAKIELAAAKGPNVVVVDFMDAVEQARSDDKIRNRDYRRLIGHAISAAKMDKQMVAAMVARFGKSKHFQREITEEAEFYLGNEKKAREETVNMAENFKVLQKALP